MKPRRNTRVLPAARYVVLVQLAIALVVAWFLFTSTGLRLPFSASPYDVTITLPNASGLAAANHPEVTVAGVRSGTVIKVSLVHGHAVVVAQLAPSVRGRLFRDASVRIYPRSDLNDLVMDILPGTPAAGRLQGTAIQAGADARPVAYDQVLGTFDDQTRAYAQILIGTLQTVLAGRSGPLAAALETLPSATASVTALAQQVQARRTELEALVGQFDQIVTATGERGQQITQAVALAKDTLQVVGARQRDLETAMRRLPGFLTSLHGSFAALRDLGTTLNPALDQLKPAARALPAALRETRRLIPALSSLTDNTTALARSGTAPLSALRGALGTLATVAPQLKPVVHTTDALVQELVENEGAISSMTSTWPRAMSGQTAVGVTTRTKFLGEIPIDPSVFGLPSNGNATGPVPLRSASAQGAALESALDRVRREYPKLLEGAPADEPIELQAVRAPLTLLCLRKSFVACLVLAQIDAHPPTVLK